MEMGSQYFVAFNRTRAREIAKRVQLADTPHSRAKGLLGRASLAQDEGMWIAPCSMVHTFFMSFAIDVVFLDRENRVLRVCEGLKSWRVSPWVLRGHSVLELAGSSLKGTLRKGDVLEFRKA
jgi:uncharacterized membrane protein (UPF0127 family)